MLKPVLVLRSFLWMNSIPLYDYIINCLSVHPRKEIWAVGEYGNSIVIFFFFFSHLTVYGVPGPGLRFELPS